MKGYIQDGSGLSARIRVAKTIESAMTVRKRTEENICSSCQGLNFHLLSARMRNPEILLHETHLLNRALTPSFSLLHCPQRMPTQ